MKKKSFLYSMLAIMMVVMLSVCLTSCKDDDEEKDSDLVGYWVKEVHLNNPVRNGSGGTVTSYGFQFLDNGKVYVFQLQHTGLGSRYSYAEASTSWEKMTERNGVSFYINPDKKLKNYTRTGNQIFIDITSEPTILTITGTDRINAISSDGWAEGNYVRIEKYTGGTAIQPDPDPDPEMYVINDNEILMGVNTLENGWYSYVLQFGFGASGYDAYKNGITQMKLTYWADNGCLDTSYKTYNYGKKRNETLYLSSTKKDWYGWIYVNSPETKITFNYELEYYNSKDGIWYNIQSRKLIFNAK